MPSKLINSVSVDNGDGTITVTDTVEVTRVINVVQLQAQIDTLKIQVAKNQTILKG